MIKIVQGNDVNLHVPLVEKDAEGNVTAIDFANVTDLSVTVTKGSEEFTDFTTYTAENTVVICLNENAPKGSYSILITAKNNGVDICYNAKGAFEIVRYNAESTYTDYIADEDVTLDTGLFVAAIVNDTQVEELREELQAKIEAAEESKAAYDEAAENLVDLGEDLGSISQTVQNAVGTAMQSANVAKQGTDPTVTLTIIKALLDNLDLTNVAKQGSDSTATLTSIKSALDNMDISNVAKQGDNPNATNTAILAAFGNIDFSTLAKQGLNSAATNTAILSAITNIDLSSLATLSGQQSAAADLLTLKTRIGEATDAATASTLFGKITSVLSAISNIDFSSVASQTSVDAIQSDVTDLITSIAALATEANATTNKTAILNDIAAKASAILGADTTATLTALKTAIANLSIPTVQQIQSGLAKSSELPTDYAKQGSNANATLSDTQSAVKNNSTNVLAELLNNTYGLAALETLVRAIAGYALQGSDNTATNTAIKSAIATLATAVANIPTTTPATPTDVSNAQTAIINAMPSVSGLASETSVKDGNDTTIAMLKNATYGLAAIKAAIGGGGGGGGDVSVSAADWTALITAVNQLTGSELVYADTAPDITAAITALRSGVTFANVAKWWSLPTLLCERKTIITAISDSSIETVGDYAFQNATALTSVNFPNATTIGQYAFQNATALTSVNFPNATTIGQYAFQKATALTSVNLPEALYIGRQCFHDMTDITYLELPKATTFNYQSFLNNFSLKRLILSEAISGDQTVYQCYSLEYAYIPKFGGANGNDSVFINFATNLKYVNCINISSSSRRPLNNSSIWRIDTSHNGALSITNSSRNNANNVTKLYGINILVSQIFSDYNISGWNPTEGFSTSLNTLVPQQEWDLDENGDPIDCSQFTTNADKALWCFKHLFMPAFQTVTNQTLTLESTVYDVVMNDTDVSTYFSTHGWTVARVA